MPLSDEDSQAKTQTETKHAKEDNDIAQLIAWILRTLAGLTAGIIIFTLSIGGPSELTGFFNAFPNVIKILGYIVIPLVVLIGVGVIIYFIGRLFMFFLGIKGPSNYPDAEESLTAFLSAISAVLFFPLGLPLSIVAFILISRNPEKVGGQGSALFAFTLSGFLYAFIGSIMIAIYSMQGSL